MNPFRPPARRFVLLCGARRLANRLPPTLPALLLILTALPLHAADLERSTGITPEDAVLEPPPPAHPFCNTKLVPTYSGRLVAKGGEYGIWAGLWVGAIVDRGTGPEMSVSTGLYQIEYCKAPLPGDPINMHPTPRKIRVAYTDTCAAITGQPHTPLDVKVVQTSTLEWDPQAGDYVRVEFEVRNISFPVPDPEWDLEMVYFGLMIDVDVGIDDRELEYWNDDQVAFVPDWWQGGGSAQTSGEGGDLAYAYDDPYSNPEDNVDTQVGVVSLDAPMHVFRVWSGGAEDPTSDVDRYLFLRGDSDIEPTIDPPTVRATDYRFLVSVGPFERIEPHETERFTVALVCGKLVSEPPGAPVFAHEMREVRQTPGASIDVAVAPNPVRLAGSSAGLQPVRFTHLPLDATIGIYSVQGRLVRSLDAQATGIATWNLHTDSGAIVPPGIYFYRVATRAEDAQLGKLVVLR